MPVNQSSGGNALDSTPANEPGKKSGSPSLAIVATTTDRLPAADRIGIRSELIPGPGCLNIFTGGYKAPEEYKWSEGSLVVPVHDTGAMLSVALMPAPIPGYESWCSAAWWWRQGAEAMATHKFHFIVALLGGDGLDPVKRAAILTRATAAVAYLSDSVAVYWGAGNVLQSASTFSRYGRFVREKDVPILLWVSFHMQPTEDGRMSLVSTGMEALGFREIEIANAPLKPSELYEFGSSTAAYIVNGRVQLSDGETVGRTAEEKWRVSYGPSLVPREGEVMQLHPPQ